MAEQENENTENPISSIAEGEGEEITKLPSQDDINQLKEELNMGATAATAPVEDSTSKYKSENGIYTYYYKNISNESIIFSSKIMNAWRPGECMDFADVDWVKQEEDILGFKDLKNLQRPLTGPAKIKRLTPMEYFQELRRVRDIRAKKDEAIRRTKEIDSSTKEEEISEALQYRLGEYLDWAKLDEKAKKQTEYNKYNIIEWLDSFVFNEQEFRYLKANLQDGEVSRAVLTRWQEIQSNSQPALS